MIKYKGPMLDSEFLKQLSMHRDREIYAKIVALDLDENPIEEIQGRVTQGSVPVDGNSIVRRTCSLTLVAHDLNINDYIWGVKTKIKLYIGLTNNLNSDYPPIVWFKMGTFVLTSFNNSISASGHTVSIQGKDKMCLLNGDIGGNLTALSYDFGSVKVTNKSGYTYTEQIPIKKIIQKAVSEYAKEPYHNIILNDLDDCGLELIEYRGDSPLYFVYDRNTQEVSNMIFNQNQVFYLKTSNGPEPITIAEIEGKNAEDIKENLAPRYIFKQLIDDMSLGSQDIDPTDFYGYNENTQEYSTPYNLIKITKGMTCGYRTCELVYAGKLTAAAGEPITGMLTKIVNMLGNYEYFYNLDGQFVFQRKRTYVNTSWNNMVNNGEEDWVENSAYTNSFIFSFEDGTLITSYQNAPNLANLKNDFSIWGTRPGVSGAQIPIHLRYAIDNKPTYYTALDGITYTTRSEEEVEWDKKNFEYELPKGGYQKEPSRFGLSEDWWEVRDWAKAWEFSGLPVPTKTLGTYCPIRALIYDDAVGPPDNVSETLELVPIYTDTWHQWGRPGSSYTTDDLIFSSNGRWIDSHGWCGHTYTWWLQAFTEKGTYGPDCFAYFYKPQVPADEIANNGGAGLILGEQIKYSCDWRELIYRMSYDFKNYSDRDNPPSDSSKPQVYRDNFLMAVKEKNPSFYPTGYTGYEQYYTDIYEFWRQLYNPDYVTSFDITYLSSRRYMEEGKLGLFFYDAPIYTQCNNDDPFFSGVMYYIMKDGEYVSCPGLLQGDYGKNPSQYYMITGTQIEKVPLYTEPFVVGENNYWVREQNGFVAASNIGEDNYAGSEFDLYLRTSEYSYFPCVTIKPWVSGKLYFTKQEDGSFKPDTTVKEDIYLKSPGVYYERAIVGGQIIFSCCTKIQEFDENREYYIQTENQDKTFSYERVYIDKESYDGLDYAHNELYYAVINYSYLPCIHPKYDYDPECTYYVEGLKEYELDPNSPNLYWNKKVQESPESLNFWFDFLDTYGELSQYSVSSVGDRPKAVNDSNVKAIYFRETPGVIFVEDLNNLTEKKSGYTYAQLPQHLEYMFSISGQGKSAKDVLDNFLYTHSYCVESITISAIPIYHLEPNTRIFVRDDRCGINGEYIVTRINYPLAANGTMSINATKVVDRLY